MEKKFNYYFAIYILSIICFAIFWLYLKHTVGNDSTISEWMLNYQGGFTRRGLPGEIAFHIANFFEIKLRFVIFLIQSIFYTSFLLLIYYFFKNIRVKTIILFAIFTPIFLLYHVAELEILARKEIFLFIGYIWFYNISSNSDDVKKSMLWVIFILPIVSILYEPSIFYYSFFVAVLLIKMRNQNLLKTLLTIFIIFIPALVVSWFSATYLISNENWIIMKDSLMNNFGEGCYMSCDYLQSKKSIKLQFLGTISKLTEKEFSIYAYLFRYFLILLVGFGPLIILTLNSKLNFNFLFFNRFKNIFIPFLLLNLLVPVHWLMFIDWGRAVNIAYVSSVLFFFYLYKNNLINIDFDNIEKKTNKILELIINKSFFKKKKSLLTFIFIIYGFGWSPPTLLSADVNSFPGYRIPYKTVKAIVQRLKN